MKYKKHTRKGYVLVRANGRINYDNKNKLIDAINNSNEYTIAEKQKKIRDLEELVKQRHNSKKKLTTNGFEAKYADGEVNKLISSLGMDADTLAGEIGATEDDILDESNWIDGQFIFGGITYNVNHNYNGNVFVKA